MLQFINNNPGTTLVIMVVTLFVIDNIATNVCCAISRRRSK